MLRKLHKGKKPAKRPFESQHHKPRIERKASILRIRKLYEEIAKRKRKKNCIKQPKTNPKENEKQTARRESTNKSNVKNI